MRKNNIKQAIFNFLIENNVLIDYDVYAYGYAAFISYFCFAVIMLPISLILDIFIEVIAFLIFFIPLRRYIGGYHFDSKLLCLIFSIIFSIIIPFVAIWSGFISFPFRMIVFLIVVVITLLVKAVDHPNKRINKKEKTIYTRKAILIEITYFLVILIAYNQYTYLYLNIALFTVIFCTLGILIAKLKMVKY